MDVYFAFWQGTSFEDILFTEDETSNEKHLTIGVRFLIAVMVEHVLILVQYCIENVIPAEPEWVRIARSRSKGNVVGHIQK